MLQVIAGSSTAIVESTSATSTSATEVEDEEDEDYAVPDIDNPISSACIASLCGFGK